VTQNKLGESKCSVPWTGSLSDQFGFANVETIWMLFFIWVDLSYMVKILDKITRLHNFVVTAQALQA
jgi:hypothetical protein